MPSLLQSHWIHICLLVQISAFLTPLWILSMLLCHEIIYLIYSPKKFANWLDEFPEWLHDFTDRMDPGNLVN